MAYKTIIIEDRIESIVNLLPNTVNNFKTVFGVGDELEMLNFLNSKVGIIEQTPYPLIWLVYPFQEKHGRKKVYCEDLKLLLVVKGSSNLLNKDRLEKTYKILLIPLFEELKKLFRIVNFITVENNEYEITKFPNYSTDDEGYNFKVEDKVISGEIWDVLKVQFNCTISDNCLKIKK